MSQENLAEDLRAHNRRLEEQLVELRTKAVALESLAEQQRKRIADLHERLCRKERFSDLPPVIRAVTPIEAGVYDKEIADRLLAYALDLCERRGEVVLRVLLRSLFKFSEEPVVIRMKHTE